MGKRIWIPVMGLVLTSLILLGSADNASAGLEVKTATGQTTFKFKQFPSDVTLHIFLTGSTVEQANVIIIDDGDPENTPPNYITQSNIERHYSQPGIIEPQEVFIKYFQAGEFPILVQVKNNTNVNGTVVAKTIQEKTILVTIEKDDESSGPAVELDIAKFIPYIIGVVVLIVVIIGIKVVYDRGGLGLSMPGMPSMPGGGLPPPTPPPGAGGLSSLGGAHDASTEGDKAAASPKAKRDCPSCGTAIPITTDKRPLKLTCPNGTCGKSFTLKGKSGAVGGAPRRKPRRPGAGKRPGGRKGSTPGGGRRRPRRPGAPKAPAGRTRPGGPPGVPKGKAKPPAPKAKPPAPKAKPLHCPDDGAKLDHYPNAAKKYGYDSDYFCPTCELYVVPKEHAKAHKEEKPSVSGPFGGAEKPKPKPKKEESKSDGADEGHPGGEIECPNCQTKHEVPAGSTKSIMCSCGRRLRVKQG